MRSRLADLYPWVWFAFAAWFILWEATAFLLGRHDLTLSDYVWRLEEVNARWTFLRYLTAAFTLWLFFHLTFGWFR
jgi:hypothetical protein